MQPIHPPARPLTAWREAMPMREPFLFLEEPELTAEGARGVYRITGREEALRGHFKHAPVMPASLMLEALGQLGVFFLLHDARAAAAAGGPVGADKIFLASCDGVRCGRVCRPGDLLQMSISVLRLRLPLAVFAGAISVGPEKAARAEEFVLSFGA